MLFYGWSTEDIRLATLSAEDQSTLTIVHHRTPRTKGRRYYNRPQKLQLPTSPNWFYQLQKRFYLEWLNQFQNTKQTFPRQPLVLTPRGNHNRSVSSDYINDLLGKATQVATGIKIPLRILHQTCSHIYTANGDASILSRMGWSPQFAFHYRYLARTYYRPPTPTASPAPDSTQT